MHRALLAEQFWSYASGKTILNSHTNAIASNLLTTSYSQYALLHT